MNHHGIEHALLHLIITKIGHGEPFIVGITAIKCQGSVLTIVIGMPMAAATQQRQKNQNSMYNFFIFNLLFGYDILSGMKHVIGRTARVAQKSDGLAFHADFLKFNMLQPI